MEWRKTIIGGRIFEGITLLSIVLLLISFYYHNNWMIFLGALLLVITRMSIYYLSNVSKSLVFENGKETIRLSVGEEAQLVFKVSQLSRIPVFKAFIHIRLEDIVSGAGDTLATEDGTDIEFIIPVQIGAKESVLIPLDVKALKRGTTRIKSLELHVQNFFGFGSVKLKYTPFVLKEIIIHPVIITVPQSEQLAAVKSYGDFPTHNSMFEQILAPIGTRDYVYSDSFQRIHWKASAKTQKLQTKVFEKASHYSWTFIINLRVPNSPNYQLGIVKNYESIASNIAYLAQVAVKRGIQFELFLNLRMASQSAVYHLPIGSGIHQLGKVLDSLSRVTQNGNTMPMKQLLNYVDKQQCNSPVVILSGPVEEEAYPHLYKYQKKGQKVYILRDDAEYPVIVPFGRPEVAGIGG
jgi:uncharacterized protein (DUF58 family)